MQVSGVVRSPLTITCGRRGIGREREGAGIVSMEVVVNATVAAAAQGESGLFAVPPGDPVAGPFAPALPLHYPRSNFLERKTLSASIR